MTRAVALAMLACSIACARLPLDVGAVADSGAAASADSGDDADATTDAPIGPDELVVRVVDGRRATDAVALDGVLLVVDDARGRRQTYTDTSGEARVSGVDYTGDPPDVTFYRDGFPLLTVLDLGSDFVVPPVLVVALGALNGCHLCPNDYDLVTGPIDRVTMGGSRSRVVTALSGVVTESSSEEWFGYVDPILDGTPTVSAIELLDGASGPRIVGVAAHPLPIDRRLTLAAPAEVASAEIVVERRLAAVDALASIAGRAMIVEEDAEAQLVSLRGVAAIAPSDGAATSSIDYVPIAGGRLAVVASVSTPGGIDVAFARAVLPVSGPLVLDPPPGIDAGVSGVVIPRDTLAIRRGAWEHVMLVVSRPVELAWSIVVPSGATSVVVPAPPEESRTSTLPRGAPYFLTAVGLKFSGDPRASASILQRGWAPSNGIGWSWSRIDPCTIE